MSYVKQFYVEMRKSTFTLQNLPSKQFWNEIPRKNVENANNATSIFPQVARM